MADCGILRESIPSGNRGYSIMYKSIVFDLGGVMVDFDPKAYLVDRLCNA